MKLALKHALAAIILVLSLAAPVAAGALQDAMAAYFRNDYAAALWLFRALANQGNWIRPTAIRYVLDSQRKLLEENTPVSKQVVSNGRLLGVRRHGDRATYHWGQACRIML
jgi:hypothetical protein